MDIGDYRIEYLKGGLKRAELCLSPFSQFEKWFVQASDAKMTDPNAMIIATVSKDGKPSQRTVLLKMFDENGFVFFTNYGSNKAQQIEDNSHVSLLFPWLELERQVEINGHAVKISKEESLEYFQSRPHGSQLGAWASTQSKPIASRDELDQQLTDAEGKYAEGEVPLPHWGGYRVVPETVEFWQGGARRLHDRFEYSRTNKSDWLIQRLQP
ncbi:MAG: pyridoxamine 5'-phosphate oxidase [Cocleimonas sp.]|jgi:pyridoxamine 5'-phosphate oxidase